MSEKWIVIVYAPVEEVECDSELEADHEIDLQDRLYGHICRTRVEEYDDEDGEVIC